MKYIFIILALIVTPCMIPLCTAITSDIIRNLKCDDETRHYMKMGYSYDDARIEVAYDKGLKGDICYLSRLEEMSLISSYCKAAASMGRKDHVAQCIIQGANPNDGLENAAKGGHISIVEYLLDHGATDFNDALSSAAEGGHMNIVQLMLENGATDYNRGLKYAAMEGHMDIVQLMLEKGATDYNCGLENAAMGGHMDIVQLMLEKGAEPDMGMKNAAHFNHKEIVQLLLERGADPNKGMAAAAKRNYIDIAQLLLAAGASPNMGIENAALAGHDDLVSFFIQKGADPGKGLHGAAEGGHINILKSLLRYPGVNIHNKNIYGETPLDKAKHNGRTECVNFILSVYSIY